MSESKPPADPTEEARLAYADALARRQVTDRILAEADIEFGAIRGHLDRNHIADKVKAAIFGRRAA